MDTLTTEELIHLLEDEPDTLLINVVDEEAFAAAHIPHSYNVPVSRESLEKEVEELVGTVNTPTVVYSADIECDASEMAALRLEGAGFVRVYDYEGGLRRWLEVGRGIEDGLV
jgi:rhodanese-related sulfurtransferase